MTLEKPDNKSSSAPSDCCDELLIEYIDAFNANLANLRPDLRQIVSEEVDRKLDQILSELRELRKPRRYVEPGYR